MKYVINKSTLDEIGDAVRSKEGSSGSIPVTSLAQRITDMPSGTDTSDATAVEEHVLDGDTFYADGEKKTGSMPRHTPDNNDVVWAITSMAPTDTEAQTAVTIPEGHYEGGSYPTAPLAIRFPSDITPGASDITVKGGAWFTSNFKVKGDANLVAGNIKAGISIFDTTGTFTSDATANANNILKGKTAYVNGSKVTGSMKSIGAATIMPGTVSQYIDPGVYISGTQTIKGDPSLVAGNIKKGVSIFGVAGSHEGDAPIETCTLRLYNVNSTLQSIIGSVIGGDGRLCVDSIPYTQGTDCYICTVIPGTFVVVELTNAWGSGLMEFYGCEYYGELDAGTHKVALLRMSDAASSAVPPEVWL